MKMSPETSYNLDLPLPAMHMLRSHNQCCHSVVTEKY